MMRSALSAILLFVSAHAWALDPAPRTLVAAMFDDVSQQRKGAAPQQTPGSNARTPKNDAELRYWLQNMVWHHRFTAAEVLDATGLTADAVQAALKKFDISAETRPQRPSAAPLLTLPYPGGRHPRIGFLDGAIRPQRETKFSVFLPWDESSYVVADVPEAIRLTNDQQRGLLYLAHTHVDTLWTKRGIELEKLEWQRRPDGAFVMERRLPNKVVFGTKIVPKPNAVHMEMWLTNGSQETLTGLRVQNCVMLKGAPEFAGASVDGRVVSEPYVALRSAKADRWLITAWDPCLRVWGNSRCPCLHSDPKFPDSKPGQTQRLRGWLSFYEGRDIKNEIRRIDKTGWRTASR